MSNRRNKNRQPQFRQQHRQQELEDRYESVEPRPSGAPPTGMVIVKQNGDMTELGSSGLSRWGGQVNEEFLSKLKGSKGYKVYTEMRYNDPVVAAMLRCISWICRSVDWAVNGENEKQVEFLDSCRDDMSLSWDDFVAESLTMLPYGWAWAETVYKWRKGPDKEPASKYDDGKIGWRKFAFRSQGTLWEWQFDDNGGVQGMIQSVSGKPNVTIPIAKSLLFRTTAEKGNPEGESILRPAYVSYYMLKNLQEIEGIGIERNMNGLPVIYLGEGTSNKGGSGSDYEKAKELVRDIRKDEQMGVVLPWPKMTADGKGGLLELLSGGSTESMDVGAVIARYEKRIALSMLAQWLMLGMDQVGSYALSKDQTDFFRQAVEAVLKMITSVLNRFAIPRLFDLNPELRKLNDDLPTIDYSLPIKPDFAAFATAVNSLVSAQVIDPKEEGLRDMVRSVMGLPEEEVLPEPEEVPVSPVGPEAMMQAAAATAQQPGQPPGASVPEAPPKPMPPEMIAQQGKLQAAAEAMKKGGPGSGRYPAGSGGEGGTFDEKVPVKWTSGTKRMDATLRAAQDPAMYHGGYAEDADSISTEGIRASDGGTAGPGVYLTDVPKDAIYERDPNRSAGVMAHDGRQPDHAYETQVRGRVLDVGVMESKNGPSIYLRPDVYAAMVLESTAGRQPDIGGWIRNPGSAGQVIAQHGYSGVAWTFADGDRRGTVVFDPSNVAVMTITQKSEPESAWQLATADIDVWAEADKIIAGATKAVEKEARPKRGRPRKNAHPD